jgi:hypothetical protein
MNASLLRRFPLLGLFVSAFLAVTGCAPQARYVPTARYQELEAAGVRIYVSPDAASHTDEIAAALAIVRTRLLEARELLGPAHFGAVRSVSIWIEYEPPRGQAMGGYHSMSWIARHGLNPDKAKNIELADVRAFARALATDRPLALVHELAHVYYDRVIGEDDAALRAAYAEAVRSRKYEHVATRNGPEGRAYALSSSAEYFAELTEAYFGNNDYFPFDRKDLTSFDPEGAKLVEAVWGGPR